MLASATALGVSGAAAYYDDFAKLKDRVQFVTAVNPSDLTKVTDVSATQGRLDDLKAGSLLGIVVGCGLGALIVTALKDQGLQVLAFPWTRMALFLVLAVIVGLLAAIIPAIRASRVNVLRAIAYE